MLSRTLRRVLLDSSSHVPPTFLLPWTARINSLPRRPDAVCPSVQIPNRITHTRGFATEVSNTTEIETQYQQGSATLGPELSSSVRELLPLLKAQAPHYITVHIHGFPYLVTQGDTIRLPFLMHGVEPGDVLRLDKAINLGSRDFTLKAPSPPAKSRAPGSIPLDQRIPNGSLGSSGSAHTNEGGLAEADAQAPHFIPHIAKGKHAYLDERLFTCRAIVLGVESEPMRIKEKTKRRQRHVRQVRSKHRYTILKIKELCVNELEDIAAR